MPQYWRKQIFTHGSFPEAKEREIKKDRKLVITLASNPPRVAHAKPPGPKVPFASAL